MRIAVTGKAGQVVQSLLALGPAHGHTIIALGRPELDLANVTTVGPALATARPDVIVSAAAYTMVDKAEAEVDLAFAVNVAGASAVAEAAAALGVPLVHLSTDFVFDGTKPSPYVETDPTGPLGAYGASKLAGEHAVQAAHANTTILRTAWVFSPFGSNFLKTMLRLADDRDEVGVVADQYGNPTSALDIATAILRVSERLVATEATALRDIFHMTGHGSTHWAGLAEAIFDASARHGGPTARVRPITTADYPTPTRRPGNSRLDCSKLDSLYGIRLPDWAPSVDACVARYLSCFDRMD